MAETRPTLPVEVIVTYHCRPVHEFEASLTEFMEQQGYRLFAKGMDFAHGERTVEYVLDRRKESSDNP